MTARLPGSAHGAAEPPAEPDGSRPLPARLATAFGSELGADLSSVRVRTDAEAGRTAERYAAVAYTSGTAIGFAPGAYDPATDGGRRLIAHEVAHVVQQQRRPDAPRVQLQEAPATGTAEVQIGSTYDFALDEAAGTMVISYRGRQWARLGWTPQAGRSPAIYIDTAPGGANLRIVAGFRVTAEVDRSVEQQMVNWGELGAVAVVRHQFEAPGSLSLSNADGSSTAHRGPTEVSNRYIANWVETPDLPIVIGEEPTLEVEPREWQPRTWSFATRAELAEFARTHPDTKWAGIATADGQFVAWGMTNEAMRRAAEYVRGERPDLAPTDHFPGSTISGIWLNGAELGSLDDLGDLYYRSAYDAKRGTQGDAEECEVFHMGGGSYGRIPYTHAEAIARWAELDRLTYDQITDLESRPNQDFTSLNVRTTRGLVEINWTYYQAKRTFTERADDFNRSSNYDVDGGSQRPLHFFLERARRMGPLVRRFLLIETTRESGDPAFRQLLNNRDLLANDVGEVVINEVEAVGQRIAVDSLRAAEREMRTLSQNPDALKVFVLGYPLLSAEAQENALQVMGLEGAERLGVHALLDNPQSAREISLGVQFGSIDLEMLGHRLRRNANQVAEVAEQLRLWRMAAIHAEGAFGNSVRDMAYARMGFGLRGRDYPHGGQTPGIFPDALAGSASSFNSMAEQMWANRVAARAHGQTVFAVLGIVGAVAATVVLVLVAQAAGAAVAGLLFAEGSAAFIATEIIVGGVVLTGLEAGAAGVTGQQFIDPNDPRSAEAQFGIRALQNIAMFGIFKALGAALNAVGRSGATAIVGGEEAYEASVAAQRGVAAFRVTGTGAAFLGMSLDGYRREHGHYPQGEDLYLLLFENILTLGMLEVGGVLARPLTARAQLWARGRRLARLEGRIGTLNSDITVLQRDLAAFTTAASQPTAEANALIGRQRAMLLRQRAMAETIGRELRAAGDRTADAQTAREVSRIDDALRSLREVQFLASTRITPETQAGDSFRFPAGAEARIRQFYGPENVTDGPGGSLQVRVGGRQLSFRPVEGTSAAAEPAGGRTGQGTGAATEPAAGRPGQGTGAATEPAGGRTGAETAPRPATSTAPTRVPSPQTGATRPLPARVPPSAPVDPLRARQETLKSRQQEVVGRAGRFGLSNLAEVEAVARLVPRSQRLARTLENTDRLLTRAERAVDARTADLGRQALERVRRRLGPDIDARLRSGRLADMTIEQVGEALHFTRGARGLGVAELRGVLHMARAGVLFDSINLRARTAAERNLMLRAFGEFLEAGTPGAEGVLRTMVTSRNQWRGGTLQMEFGLRELGVSGVRAFEVRESAIPTEGGREAIRIYDIIGTDGTRYEMKDWSRWFGSSLRSQYRRDMIIGTRSGTDPNALLSTRWVFRSPAPRTAAEIRETMRLGMEDAIAQMPQLTTPQQQALRAAFARHADAVTIWAGPTAGAGGSQ